MSYMTSSRALKLGISFTLLAFFAVACTKKEVTVYQTAKEMPPVSAPQSAMGGEATGGSMMKSADQALPPAANSAPLRWTAPASWKSVPPSSQMRMASFEVPAAGDASIVVLAGDAGGLAANVNRWRGQIGLSNLEEAAIAAQMKPIHTGFGMAKWIRIADPKKPESGILATIISFSDSSIFVKLVAPIKTLDLQQANFLALVSSLHVK